MSSTIHIWLAYAMAALFLIGGVVNLKPPQAFVEGYARWGYPSWWHYVTAACDLAGGTMLLWPASQIWGVALLGLVTLAAILSLIRSGEFARLPPAFVLLAGLVALV